MTKQIKSAGTAGMFIAPLPVDPDQSQSWVHVLRLTTADGEPIEIQLSRYEAEHLESDIRLIRTATPEAIECWLDNAAQVWLDQNPAARDLLDKRR
ncbi:hypothetical protein BH09ACT8_BH09ACT8_59080 [soil metagenome]